MLGDTETSMLRVMRHTVYLSSCQSNKRQCIIFVVVEWRLREFILCKASDHPSSVTPRYIIIAEISCPFFSPSTCPIPVSPFPLPPPHLPPPNLPLPIVSLQISLFLLPSPPPRPLLPIHPPCLPLHTPSPCQPFSPYPSPLPPPCLLIPFCSPSLPLPLPVSTSPAPTPSFLSTTPWIITCTSIETCCNYYWALLIYLSKMKSINYPLVMFAW